MAVTVTPHPSPHCSSSPNPTFGSGRIAEAAFLLLAPVLAFIGLHFEPVNQNLMLDPYLYTGYIHNFHDLMARYGVTYYSVRFGLLFPARLSTALFGVQGGYLVLRYLLALLFAVPLYRVCKQYLGMPVAIVAYVAALSSPFLARILLWNHPDAAGVPFLMAAICLLLLDDPRPGRWRPFLAGCCLGMAANCNIFILAIFGIFVAVLAGLWIFEKRPWRSFGRMIAPVVVGALMICAAGSIYYRSITGRFDIFSITWNMVMWLSRGGFRIWREPGAGWTTSHYHVYLPVWIGVCCLIQYSAWKREFVPACLCWYGVAVTAFYYVHQFVLGADTLQLFYYFSYAAPALFLMLALLYRRLRELAGMGSGMFVGVALVPLVLPWALVSTGQDPLLNPRHPLFLGISATVPGLPPTNLLHPGLLLSVTVAVLTTTVLAILRFRPRGRATRALALLAIVLLGVGVDAGLASYSAAIRPWGSFDTAERDVYRVALQLVDVVPQYRSGEGILFWYNNRRMNSINSVQSMYLWGYSRLNAVEADAPGLPYLGKAEMARLREPQIRYLGLLCESPGELAQAKDALQKSGISYAEQGRRELQSGGYRVYWALLDLRPR